MSIFDFFRRKPKRKINGVKTSNIKSRYITVYDRYIRKWANGEHKWQDNFRNIRYKF